jgi:ribonuclease P protein component
VLPAPHRMRHGRDFTLAVRRGRRAGSARLAVHILVPPAGLMPVAGSAPASGLVPARVGFVVSKAVGTAVVRNRVKRRLRVLAAQRLHRMPGGALAVVRANSLSAASSSAELAADLDRALDRVLGRAQ